MSLHWLERRNADGEVVAVEGYRTSRSPRPVASATRTLRGWRPELRDRFLGRAGQSFTREQAIEACEVALVVGAAR